MQPRSERFISLATRETVALILAGGRGSRLGGLTRRCAKPAVPFGGKFRIIDFPLSNCMNSGIRRVGVLSQYMAQPLVRHLQQGWGFLRGELGEFIELLPAQQRRGEHWYTGTADAVYQNLDLIRELLPEYVLVLGGDHVYKMDYGPMLGAHVSNDADITIGCIDVSIEQARSFGVMTVDGVGKVCEFQEKPANPVEMPGRPGHALASMGIYVFATDYLMAALEEDAADPTSLHDFGNDVIPRALSQGKRVYAYSFEGPDDNQPAYWRDVGSLDGYWEANMELVGITPELNLYDADWPIWTYQYQVPPAKFVFDDEGRRGVAVDSMVAGGCILSGGRVHRSILFHNVLVGDGSTVEQSLLLPGAAVGRGCHIRRAIIDSRCRIPDGMHIGYDAEQDRRLHEISPNGIVLVTPESLGRIHV